MCLKILFAGGGTAGHINPAIAVANYIRAKKPDWDILFIGTKEGLETKLVPKEGLKIKYINIKGFKRKLSIDNLVTVRDLFIGMLQARKIIAEYKPDIVIGTGGYVSGPVVLNASMMKIPTIIHEQNAIPGVTIKILSRFADVIAMGFEESKNHFKTVNKLVHTGNPIRQELINIDKETAKRRLGLDNKPVILAVGGSLGAQKINESIVEYIKSIYRKNKVYLMFGTGEKQYQDVLDTLKSQGIDLEMDKNIRVFPYINDMNIYAASDLVICRCGAMTLSEVTAMGKPAILIPSPNVTHNHQEYNARALEKQGAAIVFTEKELDSKKLNNQIENLLKDQKLLQQMAKNSFNMGITNAAEKIYNIVIELLKESGK